MPVTLPSSDLFFRPLRIETETNKTVTNIKVEIFTSQLGGKKGWRELPGTIPVLVKQALRRSSLVTASLRPSESPSR